MSNPINSSALPLGPAPHPEELETVAVRLSKYRRILRLENVQAAALLAGVTIYTAVKFTTSPTRLSIIIGAVLLTLILVTGILLALSRGAIEWEADLLERYLHSNPAMPLLPNMLSLTDQMKDVSAKTGVRIAARWPRWERAYRRIALWLIRVALFVLLLGIWLPLVEFEPAKPIPKSYRLNLRYEILFENNSSTLDSVSVNNLASLARSARANQDRFIIEAYTDSKGSSDYNLALAKARADAVRAVLTAEGVQEERINIVAYGNTHPLNRNDTVEERSRNRRAVVRSYTQG